MVASVVAQTVLFAQDPKGTRQQVCISVGSPYSDQQSAFAVQVHLEGLRSPGTVHGADSFQALSYAFVFVREVLRKYREEGWQFFGSIDDQQPFEFEHYWFGAT